MDEVYRKLRSIADQLAMQESRQVSINEALLQLIESMKLDPTDFSWSWRMNKPGVQDASWKQLIQKPIIVNNHQ